MKDKLHVKVPKEVSVVDDLMLLDWMTRKVAKALEPAYYKWSYKMDMLILYGDDNGHKKKKLDELLERDIKKILEKSKEENERTAPNKND